MADYKDIITGTIKNIAEKVKDAAETTGVKDVYAQGIERTKSYGNIAKLTIEINGETEELKRVYQEIGKLYYEENKDAPDGFYASLFSQVQAHSDSIRAKQSDIDAIRAELSAAKQSDIDVEIGEFEDVVNNTEAQGKGEDK